MHKMRFAASVAVGLAVSTGVIAPALGAVRAWTVEDIVTVPEVTDLALADDGRTALYAVRAADLTANRYSVNLRLIDVRTGEQHDLLAASDAQQIKRIPGSNDWSAILDLGDGMQLYRIDRSGKRTPLLVNPRTMLAGSADMALPNGAAGAPRQIGILAHGWSPDGKWLWYSILKPVQQGAGPRFDEAVIAERDRSRSRIDASIELHIRGPGDRDEIVTTRPSTDRVARFAGDQLVWRDGEVLFRAEEDDGSEDGKFRTFAWSLAARKLRMVPNTDDGQNFWVMKGPRGGQLASRGVGDTLELAEEFEDGIFHSYGRYPFVIGDLRSIGVHLAVDGSSAIAGTRTIGNARYGLVLVTPDRVSEIGQGSFTKCDFSADLNIGICIREGISAAPELVRVNARSNRITSLAPVSSRHSAIAPLFAVPRIWTNRLGYKASGYVMLPRAYKKGQRYPAIIVTHGSDADERFANIGFQWEYPVQLWAERGYVVLLINDPASRQNEKIRDAFQAWSRGEGPPGPEEIQNLIWLNGVYSFEDAVAEMVAEGLVDPERVGIAGFSRGSQMVNASLTHSSKFRAASGGDGSFLDPYGYPKSPGSYNAIFGGSPFDGSMDQYLRFSPSLLAHKACGALLQQIVKPRGGAIEFHQALRAHHVPSQLTLYPGESPASDETHVFHIPSNRLRAQQENIAWFDYWLLGRRDPALPDAERYGRWDKMAAAADRPRCGPSDPSKN